MRVKYGKLRWLKQIVLQLFMAVSVLVTCMILFFIIGYVLMQGVRGLNIRFLVTKPSYLSGNIGILPDILNTVYLLIVSVIVLLPLGVGAAVYLNEYAKNRKLVRSIDFAAEILSGIPSIIYGLVGMLFFCRFLRMQTSIRAGALTLVVMNLPTIMRTTKESLLSVQAGLREGAYGLGASKWRVVRKIVIPECLDGIITGCILACGRILGESAALLFTAGFAHTLHGFLDGIKSSGATLTVALYVYAKEQGEFEVAFSIAVILLVLAVVVNLSAELTKYCFKIKKSDGGYMDKFEIENLNLHYGAFHALKKIHMNIPEREVTAFIGPSGCGKSTFLKCLNRMNDLVDNCEIEGKVLLDKEDIYGKFDVTNLRKRVGMVFQSPNPFPMSIYDNIAFGPRTHGIRKKSRLDEIVERSLRQAAIWDECKDRLKKNALGMSGGQQQRLCIARALAVEPEVLLMDEPTSALDPISTSKIEALISELKEKYTVIIVTHNMQQAARISDNTAFFLLGDMVEYDRTEKIFSKPEDKRTEDYITGRFG